MVMHIRGDCLLGVKENSQSALPKSVRDSRESWCSPAITQPPPPPPLTPCTVHTPVILSSPLSRQAEDVNAGKYTAPVSRPTFYLNSHLICQGYCSNLTIFLIVPLVLFYLHFPCSCYTILCTIFCLFSLLPYPIYSCTL